MTEEHLTSFKIALAFWNDIRAPQMTRAQQIDAGDDVCGHVVETHEDVEDFRRTHGKPDRVETPDGPLFVWEGVQFRKGRARGTLFLMPAAAASMFTGG